MTTEPTPTRTTGPLNRLWNRELHHYPASGPRLVSLGITVSATVVLYYQNYLSGALAAGTGGRNGILPDLHLSFSTYVYLAVFANLLGAGASFATGISDRYGRANIVTAGLLVSSLLCLIGFPLCHNRTSFTAVYLLLGLVEGVILVATPALVRDFSPQVGRASAMAFWGLGPVLGSLLVSILVSSTSTSTPWRDQYMVAGGIGLAVFLLALLALRELAPGLRDQLMVSRNDRALVQARAQGIDVEAALKRRFRQMLKPDILASAAAISVFLIIYYLAVGFFPIFFQTVFGYSQTKANGLGNWFWAIEAAGLLAIGYLSDKARVRKPFMLLGSIGAAAATSVLAVKTTNPHTSYTTFVVLLVCISLFVGVAYAPWMASFTETVERRNPALTATGLAVWGLILRVVVAATAFLLPHIVTTVTPLTENGAAVRQLAAGQDPALTATQNATVKAVAANPAIIPKMQALSTTYRAQLATAAHLAPATLAALTATPGDPAAQAEAVSEISGQSPADVVKVTTLHTRFQDQLATAATLDPTTQVTLLTNPTDRATGARAVAEIANGLNVTATTATVKLQALAKVPAADLVYLSAHSKPVQNAAAQLTALAAVPSADLAYLHTWGPGLKDAKTIAALTYLHQHAAAVQQAHHDSPRQWQRYFWIAVAGQLLFIPLIFVMAGYWDPRKAKRQETEHEAWLQNQLRALTDKDRTTA
ncbi:MFS transporter [Streptacidiphilus sp. PAMC 29251]